MAVVGIIPAAGSGERLGASGPKAFALCGGRSLLDWSLEVLGSVCDRVVVAVPAGYEAPPDRIPGGACRSESVRLALAAAPEADVAVVHDAARPLITRELVERCLEALEGWDGVVAAAPVADTIKEADSSCRVVRTLERGSLWAIQTPQVFRADVLRRALDVDADTLAAATDDASLVEAAGGSVRVLEAPADNLKVTRPVDLQLAEALLRARTVAD
jgi:2-C-methyl-D-erythritol 4-phosphate cytidylyltransferase